MRNTSRPIADIETRVPMQYLITSYFAASNWAFNEWISCWQDSKNYELVHKSRCFKNTISNAITTLTLSSLLVRLVVPILKWLNICFDVFFDEDLQRPKLSQRLLEFLICGNWVFWGEFLFLDFRILVETVLFRGGFCFKFSFETT